MVPYTEIVPAMISHQPSACQAAVSCGLSQQVSMVVLDEHHLAHILQLNFDAAHAAPADLEYCRVRK